jgi:hypothetical protein
MPVMFDRVEGSVAPETENAATSEPQPSPQPPNALQETIWYQVKRLERRRDRLRAD